MSGITFFEKEAFESMPLPTQIRGPMLIPVFMMKDGDEFFVINRNRDKAGIFTRASPPAC